MKIEKDYKEFLELLNKNQVKYCIVGSYAFAFHAKPRYTKDLDIFMESTKDNAINIITALKEFGFKSLDIKEEDFLIKNQIIQIGYEPLRIDILTSISGCTFGEVWMNKVKGKYGEIEVNFIGRNELIKNKRATGRKQDIADLELLE